MSECETLKDIDIDTAFDLLHLKTYQIAWVVAGICVVISVGLSLHLMYKHVKSYRKPEQQKHILRILLMVPIYSLCSFLSLRFLAQSFLFDAIRSCYEAFVIYSFYCLILNYMGSDHATRKNALQSKPDGQYLFPFNCFYYNPRSGGFLKTCTRGVLQYALVHPITSLITVILEINESLCPSSYSLKRPMIYLVSVEMISVCFAMYFLIVFYYVVHDDILRYRVINKLLAVKFVIFLSFWQSIVISFLSNVGVIHETPVFSVQAVSSQIQNFAICIEMVIAAVWHEFCFSSESYELEGQNTSVVQGIKDIIIPVDLLKDTQNAMKMKRKPGKSFVELDDIVKSSPKKETSKLSNISTKFSSNDFLNFNKKYNTSSPDDTPLITEMDIGRSNIVLDKDESDKQSIETNSDAEDLEIEDELDGVGTIRLNPTVEMFNSTKEDMETDNNK